MIKNISKNSDFLIGKFFLILEPGNEFNKGSCAINNTVWTISCQAGAKIEKETNANIAIDGENLVVTNKNQTK